MTEEVSSSLIKEVQVNLGKYIKKPPLNDKLLKKPPFRYLHDLITSIIHETGFLKGLYTEDELNSNNVKDKNAKLNFLDKLIASIKKITGEDVAARSGKIIAGLEVNKTLELLLIIGRAIDSKVDYSAIITENSKKESKKSQKSVGVKSNVPKRKESDVSKNLKKTEPTPKNSVKTSEKGASLKNATVLNSGSSKEEEQKQNNATSAASSEHTVPNKIFDNEKKESRNESITRRTSIEKRSASSEKSSDRNKSSPVRKTSIKEGNVASNSIKNIIEEEVPHNASKTKKSSINEDNENNLDGNLTENRDFNEKGKSESENYQASNEETADNNSESLKDKKKENTVQRPSSARPGSRRFSYSNSLQKDDADPATSKEMKNEKKTGNTKEETPSLPISRPRTATRPPSARPGAPRIKDRGEIVVADEIKASVSIVNVIEEGKPDGFPEEKDNFIVIESEQTESRPMSLSSPGKDQEQGKLVDQILKTQKELNESIAVDASQNKHSEMEWEIGRQRERDIITREIDKIRNFIQTLTSAANPLGKLFDFLQEDVDEMQRELQHWKEINENLLKQQLAEMEFGKMFLQPLQKQLKEVENSIQEEYLQITNIKHGILINDEKILKLINSTGKTRTKY